MTRRPRRPSSTAWLALAALLATAAPGTQARTPQRLAAIAPEQRDLNTQPATEPYEDRVLTDLPPPEDDSNGEAPAYDSTGWPRFLRLETRLGTEPFDNSHDTRLGYAVYGLLETPSHGILSIDGNHSPHAGRGTLTLRQRDLPLGDAWRANHELGVINTPLPPLARLPSRVLLPSALVQGVGAEWTQATSGWRWQASHGEAGRLDGQPTSVWRPLSGRRSSLGVQWQPGGEAPGAMPGEAAAAGWTFAGHFESARDISLLDDPLSPDDRFDADSALFAARHATEDRRLQAHVVGTRTDPGAPDSKGLWVDAEWDDGPWRHGAGLYRLDPDLSWAGQPMASDAQGVYVRSAWRTRQWSADGSLDWLRSVSRRGTEGYYATGSLRHRLGPDSQLGAGFSLREFDGRAWTSYGDWRWGHRWGRSGLRLALAGGESQADETRLTYDHDWQVPQGWSVGSSLTVGRLGAYDGLAAHALWGAALSLSAPLTAQASLRASLDTERRGGDDRQHSLNLGAQWRIDSRWSLEGQYNRNLGRSTVSTSLDPLAPPGTVITRADRSFFAVLRYELQAGTRQAPLGGRAQEGGGRIAGTVYLDANRSGTREAGEDGAAGVTVYLDNRYAVRTDAQGRFEFPFVAAGPRTVTVRNETLPLPWSVVDEGRVKVEVRLRESVSLDIPVQKAD